MWTFTGNDNNNNNDGNDRDKIEKRNRCKKTTSYEKMTSIDDYSNDEENVDDTSDKNTLNYRLVEKGGKHQLIESKKRKKTYEKYEIETKESEEEYLPSGTEEQSEDQREKILSDEEVQKQQHDISIKFKCSKKREVDHHKSKKNQSGLASV